MPASYVMEIYSRYFYTLLKYEIMKTLTKNLLFTALLLLSATSFAQLSGTYTVGGSSPTFPTLDSAFNYMEINGVSGAVRLNVRQGTHTLRTTISAISGASSSNIIQVAPDPNNSAPVIFKNRITATTDNFLINLKQGYIRFDSLQFRLDSSSKLGRIVDITGASPNITFNSCTFYGKDSTSTSTNFATIYDATSVAAINLKVLNCTFHNGAFSVYHAAQSSARETGFEFKNNRVNNFYNQGIYMSYQTQPMVQGNYIIDINKYTGCDGIYFTSCDSLTVKENQVYLNGGTGYGIYLSSCNGSAYSPNWIVNNFIGIYDNSKSSATSGLYVTSGKYNYIYYNTIYNLSKSTTSKGMYLLQSTSGQNCNVKNNNVINGGAGYTIYLSSLTGISSMDYNNYYSAGTNLAYLTSAYTSLSAWQTATSMEANSINNNVTFTSNTDLHTAAAVLNGKATPISGITTDIDLQTRNSSTPDIGADEFTPVSTDAGLIYLQGIYCSGTQDVNVRIRNVGTDTLKTVKVVWLVSVNGGSYSAQSTYNYSGKLITAKDTFVKIGTYSFSSGNTYKIKAWVTDPNSTTDGAASNDTLVTPTFATGLNGTYTIGGSSPSFPTIDSAFNTLERNGICGPVRLNVRSGVYNGQTTIGTIPGSSNTNKVVVGPDPSSSGSVVFKYKIVSTTANFIVNMKQGNIAFDSLIFIIDSSSTIGGKVFDFTANCDNITFDGCTFYGKDTATTSTNFAIIYDVATYFVNGLKVNNSAFNNGSYGIYHVGASTADEMNTEVKNSKFLKYHYHSVYLTYKKSPLVQGNYMKDANTYATAFGLYLSNCDSSTVMENQIYCSGGSGDGLTFTNCYGSATSPNRIINNLISGYDPSKSGAFYALDISSGSNTHVYYNSIHTNNQSTTSYAVYLSQLTAGQNTIFKNNNVIHSGAGLAIYYATSVAGISATDYNNYYSAGSNLGYLSANITDLAGIQTATGMEANSKNSNISFTSVTDLHTSSSALNGKATPISGITKDIDGETRNSTTPDIGGDEFTPPSVDAALINIDDAYCAGFKDVMAIIKNQGYDTIKTVKVLWMVSVNGGSYSAQTTYNYSGKLAPGNETTIKLGTYTFSTGNTYKIRGWVSDPNSLTDALNTNDTFATNTFVTRLIGTYTIGGSSPDFPTIDSAFNTLERSGICGPVRLNLRSGTYTEQTVVDAIPGSSQTNTVILGPDSANSSMPVITDSAIATTDNYVIKFKTTTYVNIDSIKIAATGTAFGRAVVFEGVNSNISLLGDSISGQYSNAGTSTDLAVIFDNTATTNRNDYLTIKDCHVLNGTYGIYLYGVGSTDREIGTRLINNSIKNYSIYGVYSYYQKNIVMDGNYVKDNNTYTSPYGLRVYYNDSATVTNNQVFVGGTSAPYGIYFYYCDGGVNNPSVLANNEVSLYNTNTTGTCYGIYAYEGAYNKVVYNSVNIQSGGSAARAFYALYTTTDSAEILNNNFVNNGTGFAGYYGTSTGIKRSDYNNYFTNGTVLAYHTAANRNTLTDLQAISGMDANSVSVNPLYKNTFYLMPKQVAIEGKALPLGYITTDIKGISRNATTPDIGVYEFDKILNDLELVSITTNASDCGLDSTQVIAIIRNFGSKSQINFDINLDVKDSSNAFSLTYTHKDSIKSQQLDTIYFEKVYSAKGGNFKFKVYTRLATDQDRDNDTLSIQNMLNPVAPVPTSKKDTICASTFHMLTTKFPSLTFLRWYNAKTGGNLITETNYLAVNNLKKDTSFYVSAVSSNLKPGSITTTSAGTTTCAGGIMFDIIPKEKLAIDSFSTLPQNTNTQKIYVYFKKGTHIGFETNPAAWQLVDSATVTPKSTTSFVVVPLTSTIKSLDKDSTYSIYLNYYAKYSSTGTSYSNSDISIPNGSGLCAFFASKNYPRTFNGQIFYKVGSLCESERVPYSLKVNPAPAIYLGKDTAYCANSGINYLLDAGPGLASYKWSTSDSTQTITVKNEGTYAVDIIDKNGCANSDDIVIKKNANPVVNIGSDTSYCANTGINYTLDAGAGYKTYKWNNASTNPSITVSSAGVYSIEVTNSVNCEARDTLTVTENKNPVVKFGKDTTYCANEGINLVLDAGAGYTAYNWSNSATSQSITVTSTGVYSVIVTDAKTCKGGDTIFVVELANPTLNLGEDTTYCLNSGINKKLDAGAGFTYKWSTGATTQTIDITGAGTYSAEIRDNNNCPDRDTMMVIANPIPVVNIGPDRILNPSFPINETLDAGPGHTSYKWSNGHIFQQIVVNAAGTYSVEVTNQYGCKATDTIVVRYWIPGGTNPLKDVQFIVFPNPAKDVLTIVSANSIIENIIVYSATGQVVYTQNPKAAKTTINTGDWADGVYMLNVTVDGKSSNVRIAIQH